MTFQRANENAAGRGWFTSKRLSRAVGKGAVDAFARERDPHPLAIVDVCVAAAIGPAETPLVEIARSAAAQGLFSGDDVLSALSISSTETRTDSTDSYLR